MSAGKSYIIKFKQGASTEAIEKLYESIAAQGGEVTDKQHTSGIPRAVATLPESCYQSVSSLLQDPANEVVDYIEEDGATTTE